LSNLPFSATKAFTNLETDVTINGSEADFGLASAQSAKIAGDFVVAGLSHTLDLDCAQASSLTDGDKKRIFL